MTWRWPHFTEDEMRCKCGCGKADMNPDFMDKLEALRVRFRKPLPVVSGYRCPTYNAKVSKTGADGPHTTGRAVDIRISGAHAAVLLTEAATNFTGFGFNQKGPHEQRFIHLDDLVEGPRPNVWSY